jgi:hypothetical protein
MELMFVQICLRGWETGRLPGDRGKAADLILHCSNPKMNIARHPIHQTRRRTPAVKFQADCYSGKGPSRYPGRAPK